jgi:hypothetical protein
MEMLSSEMTKFTLFKLNKIIILLTNGMINT